MKYLYPFIVATIGTFVLFLTIYGMAELFNGNFTKICTWILFVKAFENIYNSVKKDRKNKADNTNV